MVRSQSNLKASEPFKTLLLDEHVGPSKCNAKRRLSTRRERCRFGPDESLYVIDLLKTVHAYVARATVGAGDPELLADHARHNSSHKGARMIPRTTVGRRKHSTNTSGKWKTIRWRLWRNNESLGCLRRVDL